MDFNTPLPRFKYKITWIYSAFGETATFCQGANNHFHQLTCRNFRRKMTSQYLDITIKWHHNILAVSRYLSWVVLRQSTTNYGQSTRKCGLWAETCHHISATPEIWCWVRFCGMPFNFNLFTSNAFHRIRWRKNKKIHALSSAGRRVPGWIPITHHRDVGNMLAIWLGLPVQSC